jgi:hypothetical protein
MADAFPREDAALHRRRNELLQLHALVHDTLSCK